MGDLVLDPETALQLLWILLRGAAYFFGGFALLGFSAYVAFLCWELFSRRPRKKAKIDEIAPQAGGAFVVEQAYDPALEEAPILAEQRLSPRKSCCLGE